MKVASIGGKSPDEVVCKRITKTGSLIAHSRLCLTRREWSRYARENQDEFGELQGKYGSTHGFENGAGGYGVIPEIVPPQ